MLASAPAIVQATPRGPLALFSAPRKSVESNRAIRSLYTELRRWHRCSLGRRAFDMPPCVQAPACKRLGVRSLAHDTLAQGV